MGFITISNAIKLAILLVLLVASYYIVNVGNRYVEDGAELPLTKSNIVRALKILAIISIVYLLWKNFPVIGQVLTILIASLVLSYLLSPLVGKLEDKLVERNIKRSWAIIIVYIIIFAVIIFLLGTMIPALVKEFVKFFNYVPKLITTGADYIDNFVNKFAKSNQQVNVNELVEQLQSFLLSVLSKLQERTVSVIGAVPDKIPNFMSFFVVLAMVPIVSFYLLKDRAKILRRIREFLVRRNWTRFLDMAEELDEVMGDYIRGRLLMCVFVGIATTITMFIMRIDFALVVGVITGIADIIPYIGPFIGFVPAIILAAISSPVKGFVMAIIFLVIQWLENNVIGPIILSDRVGIHPLVILFSIYVGGAIGGVLGMIFLTPIVVGLKVIIKHFEPEIRGFFKRIIKN